MINYNILGPDLKRGLRTFCKKISEGMNAIDRNFVSDMVYGIIGSGSSVLTRIARALKENILLKKTVERLSRHLYLFYQTDLLMDNYLNAINSSLPKNPMLIIDGSDVIKPGSDKMESLGFVLDGNTGKFEKGYWTMGAVALTDETAHPIPVYEKLYPNIENGGEGLNAESKKCFQFLREHFSPDSPRVLDRGFDSGAVLKEFVQNSEKFIIRANQNRKIRLDGKDSLLFDAVKSVNCTHKMTFHKKSGAVAHCKIGMAEIIIPGTYKISLTLIVCKDFADEPLILYTNLSEPLSELALRVAKAYLMRWRIEEYHEFKKQELGFEKFRVRGLDAIQNMDLLLTIATGYIATICEKVNTQIFAIQLIAVSAPVEKVEIFVKTKRFFAYAIYRGIKTVLAFLKSGFPHLSPPRPPIQLSLL